MTKASAAIQAPVDQTPPPAPKLGKLITIDPRKPRQSPFQHLHRDDVGDVSELAQSIAAHGLIQPIVIRVVDGEEEMVAGHRRQAGAIKAGLTEVQAIVRDLTDEQVIEIQVVENAQREDSPPLKQALGYQALIERGRTVVYIAERIGRPAAYVAQRLKLLDLTKPTRKALDEERITLAVAIMLGRVSDPKLQAELLDEVAGTDWEPPKKADEVRQIIEEKYLRRLATAPFDTTSAELVPKAGACTACPKRTGQQRELFADIKSPDLCTDTVCFRSKLDALWKLRKKEAEKGGQAVLEGKDAEGINEYSGKYVRADAKLWVGDKQHEVRKLVEKTKPPTLLARDEDGDVFEVVVRADVEKVIDAKEGRKSEPTKSHANEYAAKQKAEAAKTKLRRRAIDLAIAEAVQRAAKLAPIDVLALVVHAFARGAWNETQKTILEARGLPVKGDVEATIIKLTKSFTSNGDILGMGVELALRSGAPWHGSSNSRATEIWKDGLTLAEVDFAAYEKAVANEERAKKSAKAKPKGKKPPPATPAKASTAKGKAPPKKAAKKAAKKGARK